MDMSLFSSRGVRGSSGAGGVSGATLPGHDEWVQGLSFQVPISPEEPLILASGSQDSTIRLWNIEHWQKQAATTSAMDGLSDELLDAFEESLGDPRAEEGGRQISLKRHMFTVKSETGYGPPCSHQIIYVYRF